MIDNEAWERLKYWLEASDGDPFWEHLNDVLNDAKNLACATMQSNETLDMMRYRRDHNASMVRAYQTIRDAKEDFIEQAKEITST